MFSLKVFNYSQLGKYILNMHLSEIWIIWFQKELAITNFQIPQEWNLIFPNDGLENISSIHNYQGFSPNWDLAKYSFVHLEISSSYGPVAQYSILMQATIVRIQHANFIIFTQCHHCVGSPGSIPGSGIIFVS